jgi:hypothetical protein
MSTLALVALLAVQSDAVTLKYGTEKSSKDKVYYEGKLGIKLTGSEQALNFVRTMHPFLSLEKLVVRAEGSHQVTGPKRHKAEFDEARVEMRYDDEDREYDYTKGMPPESDKDKVKQIMWFFAAGGKNYTLSEAGEYRSDDPNQDGNGEAMDLVANAITRMPDQPVKQGDAWEKEWTGSRSEKNKKGVFNYKQKVTLEKIEERNGKKVATLASVLTGQLNAPPGERDKSAEEAWTKCEGKSKLVLEVETGRILSTEGQGKVTAYYRSTAEDGSKNEITMTFTSEGKMTVK